MPISKGQKFSFKYNTYESEDEKKQAVAQQNRLNQRRLIAQKYYPLKQALLLNDLYDMPEAKAVTHIDKLILDLETCKSILQSTRNTNRPTLESLIDLDFPVQRTTPFPQLFSQKLQIDLPFSISVAETLTDHEIYQFAILIQAAINTKLSTTGHLTKQEERIFDLISQSKYNTAINAAIRYK